MGCFDGVCLLSNLPIKHGEKVLCIEHRTTGSMYELVDDNYRELLYDEEGYRGANIARPRREAEIKAVWGEYNDYGYVDHFARLDDKGYTMVRLDVIKALGLPLVYKDGALISHQDLELVLHEAYYHRRSIPGLTGQQHGDAEELLSHIKVARVTIRVAKEMLDE